jgi:hypothetical protein
VSSLPYDAPIPGATGEVNATLLAKTAYQNTLARINRSRGQTLQQYGYKGSVDPVTGVITNVGVDPYNQYGDFQSMLRNQAGQLQQADYAAQDRGLHGGLANKVQGDLHYGFGQQSAQLGQNFSNQLTDFQDQQSQAKYDYDMALWQQQQQDAANAIANGDFSPAPYPDVQDPTIPDPNADGYVPYPGAAPKAAAKAAPKKTVAGYTQVPVKTFNAPKAKPSPARVAKTTAKVTARGKPKYTMVSHS